MESILEMLMDMIMFIFTSIDISWLLIPLGIFIGIIAIIIVVRIYHKFTFSKESDKSTADDIFSENSYNNYMYGQVDLSDLKEEEWRKRKEQIRKRTEEWDKEQKWFRDYNIKGIIEEKDDNMDEYTNMLPSITPPLIKGQLLPYHLLFFNKEQKGVILLNHYYCDGVILEDIINRCLVNGEKLIKFHKYEYSPVMTDIKLLNYLVKKGYGILSKKDDILKLGDKATIVRKQIKYKEEEKINRWKAFGKIMPYLFNYTGKDHLRIAFTAGFDDTQDYANNRIGVIILKVPKMSTEDEYAKYLEREIMANKEDALYSYEIVRNFPTKEIRKKFNGQIDVALTTGRMGKSENGDTDKYNVGSFVGIGKVPLYVYGVTIIEKSCINLTIKCSTPDYDVDRLLEEEKEAVLVNRWSKREEA